MQTQTLNNAAERAQITVGFELEASIAATRHDLARELAYLLEEPASEIRVRDGYTHHDGCGWQLSADCSIATPGEPVEVQSPVFVFPSAACFAASKAVEALAACHGRAGRSCGYHIHYGRSFDSGWTDAEKHAVHLAYARWESALDELQPSWRRGDVNRYCGSLWSGVYLDASGRYECPFPEHPLFNPPGAIRYAQDNRYYKLNTTGRTIEIRHGAGTTNPAVAAAWMRIATAIVAGAILDMDAVAQPQPLPHSWVSPLRAAHERRIPGRIERLAALVRWIRRAAAVDVAEDVLFLAGRRAALKPAERDRFERQVVSPPLWEVM